MSAKSILQDILKAAATPFRQATGIGQEIVRKTAGLTPEQYSSLQQKAGKLGNISKSTSLTPQEAQDPLIAAKSLAGIGSYVVPVGKVGTGIGALNKILQAGKVAGSGALSGFGSSQQGNEVSGAVLGGALSGGLSLAGGLAQKGLKATANRFMDSVFRETIKDTKAAIKQGVTTLGNKALEKGFKGLTADGILKGSVETIQTLENKLQEVLTGSKATVSVKALKDAVTPIIKKYTQSGNTSAVSAITSRLAAIEKGSGKNIPVSTANEIKRALYEEARNAYGQVSSENMEGIKAIARSLKENIAKAVPGVDEINQELSYFGRISDSMTDKLSRGGRNNMMGLTQSVLAGGGIAGAAATGGASLIPAALLPILGSTPGKILSARALQGASKGIGAVGANQLVQKATPQIGGRAGAGVANLLGEQTQPQGENGEQNNVEQVAPPEASIPPVIDRSSLPPEKQRAYDIIMQAKQQAATGGAGQVNQEQLGQAYVAALLSGNTKAATQLKAIIEYQDTQKPKEDKGLSSTTENRVQLANSGLRSLTSLEKILKKDPAAALKAAIPGQLGARSYDSAALKAVEGLLRARSGAAVPETEVRRYMNANLPRVGDTPGDIKFKLDSFRADLEEVAQSGSTMSDIDQARQILESQGISL